MNLRSIFILISVLVTSSFSTAFKAQANSTTIYVEPQLTIIEVSKSCKINISISQVQDLAGWEFKLYYPNFILNATNIEEGPFLRAVNGTLFLIKDFNDNHNSTHGRIWAACALKGAVGATGSGALATITFKAKYAGTAKLTLADTDLIDSQMPNPNHIHHTTIDGMIRAVWGLRDVAVTNVKPLKTIVGQGYTANVNITVRNQGAYSETFNVTLKVSRTQIVNVHLYGASMSASNGWGFTRDSITSPGPTITVKKGDIVNLTLTSVDLLTHNFFVDYNGDTNPTPGEPISPDFPRKLDNWPTINFKFRAENVGTFKYYSNYDKNIMHGTFIIEEQENLIGISTKEITLNIDAYATITFTWNTTSFAKGNYTVWAYAWPVPGETNTVDNALMDGHIKVLTPGNVNGDGVVDMKDVTTILRSYGAQPSQPKWNPNLDVNCDDVIDMKDVTITLRNYGKTDPDP